MLSYHGGIEISYPALKSLLVISGKIQCHEYGTQSSNSHYWTTINVSNFTLRIVH